MGNLSMYVRQRSRRVQARIMFVYACVMSRFTMSHASIYVVCTWIHVSVYRNHVFSHIEERVHRAQARVVLFIYTCVVILYTISSVSIYAYVSEYTECELESCAHILGSPKSCHMYRVYT